MKLGVVFGYWGAGPQPGFVEQAQEAERLGYDSVWVAESWGNDAFTFGAWVAAHTSTIKIGTGVVQLAARTPTATAMAAVTLDHLSNGRLILGLGVSGPQVVEGWYGRPSNKPLARTREYVEIIRRALRRDGPLEFDGEFYPLPYRGEGSVGLGKPLKIMTHPLRADDPDLPRRRRPEERGPDRGDRRRMASALLLAVPSRGVRRSARGRWSGFRDRRARGHQRHRRRVGRPRRVRRPCSASTSAAWAPRARTTTPS